MCTYYIHRGLPCLLEQCLGNRPNWSLDRIEPRNPWISGIFVCFSQQKYGRVVCHWTPYLNSTEGGTTAVSV